MCPTVAPEGWDVSPGRAWGGAPSAGRAGRGRGRASPTQARGSARHVPLRLPFQCSSAPWVTAGRPDGLPRGSPGGFITSPCCWGSIDIGFRIQSTRARHLRLPSVRRHARSYGRQLSRLTGPAALGPSVTNCSAFLTISSRVSCCPPRPFQVTRARPGSPHARLCPASWRLFRFGIRSFFFF